MKRSEVSQYSTDRPWPCPCPNCPIWVQPEAKGKATLWRKIVMAISCLIEWARKNAP